MRFLAAAISLVVVAVIAVQGLNAGVWLMTYPSTMTFGLGIITLIVSGWAFWQAYRGITKWYLSKE